MRLLACAALLLATDLVNAQTSASPPPPRLVRSVSGTRGAARAGSFEVEDPRATFTLPQDKQVLVYFEWEGVAAGMHHAEGRWKDPSGAVVLAAPADQPASGRRFGIYWTLALPEGAASGLWALEAILDGQPAGTHTFEIRGTRAAAPLGAAQLYARARNAAATVERLGPAGETTAIGVAAALDADLVVVPFAVIDGASVLRVVLPDGRRLETREVAALNRRDAWAVLRVPGHGLGTLARGRMPGVGDTVYVLDSRDDGTRVIGQTSVVGEGKAGAGGPPRLVLAEGAAAGSPVLNGAGEQVGFASATDEARLGESGGVFGAPLQLTHARTTTVIAMDALPRAPATVSTLEQLAAQGQFMRPLSPDRKHVISGVFAANVQRGGAVPMPLDQRTSFGRGEGRVFVFVQWNPQEKRDAPSTYEVYDADNKLVGRSEPAQLKLKPKELMFSTWAFAVDRLPAATYRVDLLLGGAPVWRGWVRITD